MCSPSQSHQWFQTTNFVIKTTKAAKRVKNVRSAVARWRPETPKEGGLRFRGWAAKGWGPTAGRLDIATGSKIDPRAFLLARSKMNLNSRRESWPRRSGCEFQWNMRCCRDPNRHFYEGFPWICDAIPSNYPSFWGGVACLKNSVNLGWWE